MSRSHDQVRVAPLASSERDERQSALVARAGAEFGVFTTLVRSPDVFADFLTFGQRLLEQSTLEPRIRELLILRVAWRCQAAYVWSHHQVIGSSAGLSDDDLAASARGAIGDTDPLRALMFRLTDELVAEHRLSDSTWRDLAARYPTEQIIEISMLVGAYAMLAGALNSLGVQIEEGYPMPDWAGR